MTVKASDLAARMQATATHARHPIVVVGEERTSGSGTVEPAVVGRADTPARFTVELSRPQHRFVKRFALEADSDASAITRALLSLLETDPQVAERVRGLVGR